MLIYSNLNKGTSHNTIEARLNAQFANKKLDDMQFVSLVKCIHLGIVNRREDLETH